MTLFVHNPPPKDLRLRYQQRRGSTPAQFVPNELKCDYRRYAEDCPWICLHCRHIATDNDMTADGVPAAHLCANQNIQSENRQIVGKAMDKRQAEMDRRAAAARARRKQKAEQRAAMKEALRTPVAVIMAVAEEKKRREELEAKARKLPNDRTGGWKELSGGDYVTHKLQRTDGVDAQELVFGGKRVTPEGIGQRPGMRDEVEDGSSDDESTRDPWSKRSEEIAVRMPNTPIIPGGIFPVKLNTRDARATLTYKCIPYFFMSLLFQRYQIRCTKCGSRQDDDLTVAEESFTCGKCGAVHGGGQITYICRLCGNRFVSEDGAANHMGDAHGDETVPGHDYRFGNALRSWSRTGIRKRKGTA